MNKYSIFITKGKLGLIQKNDHNCQGTCSPHYIISSVLCLISLGCSNCDLKLKKAL